jgi:urea transport system permease protein
MPHRLVRALLGLLLLIGSCGLIAAADPEAAPPAGADATGLAAIEADLVALGGDGWQDAITRLNARGSDDVKIAYQHLFNRRLSLWTGRPVLAIDVGNEQRAVHACIAALDAEGRPVGAPLATVAASAVTTFLVKPLARSEVRKALTLIDLYSPLPDKRLAAVKDLGNKRVADALPRLRELAVDSNATMRREASASIALIAVADVQGQEAERLAAIAKLGELQSIRALDLLRELRARDGCPATEIAALDPAIAAIDSHLGLTNWVRNIFAGLSLGSILLLTAFGLAITFGLMGVINMAHGEMLMIGAVTTWACYEFIGTALPPAWFNWYYVIALPLSFVIAAGVGMLIELCIVRFLYKRPLDSLLATIGVSLILVQGVRSWKGDNLGMTAPTWFSGGWEPFPDVVLPYNRLFIIALTAACVLGVIAIFKYTRFGLMLRATVQNRQMAAANGVNTRLVDRLTFGLGSGLAGIAGCALVLLTNPTPEMGGGYIVKSFLVVVVGGVGNLLGVVCSALGLGFVEKILEPLALIEHPIRIFDATWAQVAVLILVVLFIQLRPGGLFPERGRMADRADSSAGSPAR